MFTRSFSAGSKLALIAVAMSGFVGSFGNASVSPIAYMPNYSRGRATTTGRRGKRAAAGSKLARKAAKGTIGLPGGRRGLMVRRVGGVLKIVS